MLSCNLIYIIIYHVYYRIKCKKLIYIVMIIIRTARGGEQRWLGKRV